MGGRGRNQKRRQVDVNNGGGRGVQFKCLHFLRDQFVDSAAVFFRQRALQNPHRVKFDVFVELIDAVTLRHVERVKSRSYFVWMGYFSHEGCGKCRPLDVPHLQDIIKIVVFSAPTPIGLVIATYSFKVFARADERSPCLARERVGPIVIPRFQYGQHFGYKLRVKPQIGIEKT